MNGLRGSLMRGLRAPALSAPARPAVACTRRWVETVSGIDTPAPNKVLPWEQRVLPTTKTFYGEETIHNTYTSGTVEVRGARNIGPALASRCIWAACSLGLENAAVSQRPPRPFVAGEGKIGSLQRVPCPLSPFLLGRPCARPYLTVDWPGRARGILRRRRRVRCSWCAMC
jgi:hypothetical protein